MLGAARHIGHISAGPPEMTTLFSDGKSAQYGSTSNLRYIDVDLRSFTGLSTNSTYRLYFAGCANHTAEYSTVKSNFESQGFTEFSKLDWTGAASATGTTFIFYRDFTGVSSLPYIFWETHPTYPQGVSFQSGYLQGAFFMVENPTNHQIVDTHLYPTNTTSLFYHNMNFPARSSKTYNIVISGNHLPYQGAAQNSFYQYLIGSRVPQAPNYAFKWEYMKGVYGFSPPASSHPDFCYATFSSIQSPTGSAITCEGGGYFTGSNQVQTKKASMMALQIW